MISISICIRISFRWPHSQSSVQTTHFFPEKDVAVRSRSTNDEVSSRSREVELKLGMEEHLLSV